MKLLVLFEGESGHNMTALQFLLKFSLTGFFSWQNRAKSNVGAGIAGKTSPKGKVCFFETLNMDDKMVQLDFFSLTVARKDTDEQNKNQMLRDFMFALILVSS